MFLFWILLLTSPTPATGSGRQPAFQAFVTYRYVDPVSAMEVFRLLIPRGWRAEGSVTWSADPALPAHSRFRFYNPKGFEELNFYPTRSFFWTDNRLFLSTNPPGTLRFGTLVSQPIDLHGALTRVVIPAARKGMAGTRVLTEEEVPELAELARGVPTQGVNTSAEAGKMRIAYGERGQQMEEEFYATISQFRTDLGGYFINYWYIDYVFSFRDQRGRLDSRTRLFQTMLYSLKVNRNWFAKVANVRELLAQRYMKGIRAVSQMGQTIAQAGSQMREEQQRAWEQRQQANDRIVQSFSDHIRGVERYTDQRAGREVELPAGYGNAWANDLGEYVVSESPSFNPNQDSSQHWERLEPVR
jgi:hypothetical protein